MKKLTTKEYDALYTILKYSQNPCNDRCLLSGDERWGLIENGREIQKLYSELKERGYISAFSCSMGAGLHCGVSSIGKLAMKIYEFCRTMEKE